MVPRATYGVLSAQRALGNERLVKIDVEAVAVERTYITDLIQQGVSRIGEKTNNELNVPGRHDVVVVHDLDEGLEGGALGSTLGTHAPGNLCSQNSNTIRFTTSSYIRQTINNKAPETHLHRGTLDTSHKGVAVRAGTTITIIKVLHDDGLLAGIAPSKKDDNLMGV